MLDSSCDHTRGLKSGPLSLLLVLLRMGFGMRARSLARRWALTPPFTLTLSGGVFSVPLSASRPAPPLTAILPYGARTFLFPFKGSDRPTHSGAVRVAPFDPSARPVSGKGEESAKISC